MVLQLIEDVYIRLIRSVFDSGVRIIKWGPFDISTWHYQMQRAFDTKCKDLPDRLQNKTSSNSGIRLKRPFARICAHSNEGALRPHLCRRSETADDLMKPLLRLYERMTIEQISWKRVIADHHASKYPRPPKLR